jgi:hypothetical protein
MVVWNVKWQIALLASHTRFPDDNRDSTATRIGMGSAGIVEIRTIPGHSTLPLAGRPTGCPDVSLRSNPINLDATRWRSTFQL